MDSQIKTLIYKLLRQSFTFRKMVKKLDASQYYTVDQLELQQDKKLQKLIKHCYRNVPYYIELFNKLQLKPEDIRTKNDLSKLPFLDKFIVRENFDKLTANNIPKIFAAKAETSGTTGTPSKFLRDYSSINFENAVLWRFREAVAGNGIKRVVLRGDIVVPVDKDKPPFWKSYPLNKELYMSSYHISYENAPIYYKKMCDFGAEEIYAFPSSVYLLAKYFYDLGKKIKLKAIFTSSENISDKQRKLIEDVFMCRIYDWYGQVERVSAIGQCEKGTYHIIEDYSITETIETENGFELVGTNLHNYVMPLLRFRTGDFVNLSENKCTCGRNFRSITKIQGRCLEYILTRSGNKIPLFLVTDSIDVEDNVSEAQFIQEKKGEVIVNIVKGEKYTEKDKLKIIRSIKEHASPDMLVIVNEVSSISRGANGKVISSIIRVTDDIN